MAAGSSSDEGFTTDPGIRLLTKIGDFVEPLTRFDRGHLTLQSSQHVSVGIIARQVFRVSFETTRSEGNGGLPQGVTQVADAAAHACEGEAQLASARATVPGRLSAWTELHGENPADRPAVSDCFTPSAPVGYTETCVPCAGLGKIACSLCKAAGTLTCEACAGRGNNPCKTCNVTGEVTCTTCKGLRTVVTQKTRKIRDEATGEVQTEHVQETVACASCNGAGKTKCGACGGRTVITCTTCRGQKTIPCIQCQGSGYKRCETCGGEGQRHYVSHLSCSIKETFETTVRSADAETMRVLKTLDSIDKVLALSGSHRSTSETSADTLRRETVIDTPVTTVTVEAGGNRAVVQGFGPQQNVLDYRNIAGLLLSDDIAGLEQTLTSTKLVPPRVTDTLYATLATALASEANVSIAESAAKKDQSAIVSRFKGVVTEDYITRAGAAMKTAMGRAYWAKLAKGPVAVLAIPLLYAPLDLIVRGQGAGGRSMALFGVMLITFFAALAAHYWITQQLQKQVAPEGKPPVSRIIDRLNLTRNWLLFAGGAAVVLTLLVATLTGMLFPMAPPLP